MATPVGGRLANALRATYEEAGTSQEELARALGVDQTTISGWARGHRRPPLEVLPEIERACGMQRGTILRRAGYVDDGPGALVSAIAGAPDIDETGKRILTSLYWELRRSTSPANTRDIDPSDESTSSS